jgi:hypothetical protein
MVLIAARLAARRHIPTEKKRSLQLVCNFKLDGLA